ncbi:MAG: hypothetical protein FJ387_29680 [Verrucomicrobia bacterium]|nr:hypothetical protein [Verrucomicrobiota bacterium]
MPAADHARRCGGQQSLRFSLGWQPYAALWDFVLPVAGTYHLQVASASGRVGRYQMRVDLSRGPQFESEDNGAQATANAPWFAVAAGSLQARVAGALSVLDSIGDCYRLRHLNAGNTIRVQLAFPSVSTLGASTTGISVEREGHPETLATSASGTLSYVVALDGVHFVRVAAEANLGVRALYLADLRITDGQAPLITGSSWPEEGTTSTGIWQVFTLGFSEDLRADTVTHGANYELRNAGVDGVFGTSDDTLYPILPQAYSGGLTATYWIGTGPLQPGKYRFTIRTDLQDLAGNGLAAAYEREFEVIGMAGFVFESRANDTPETATRLDPLLADGVGGGVRAGWGRGTLDLSGADVDWWSFTAQAGDRLTLAGSNWGLPCGWWGCTPRSYQVYGPEGNLLWDWSLLNPQQVGPGELPASGVYALRVANHPGDYEFRISLSPPPLAIEAEDNDALASANAMIFTEVGPYRNASLLGGLLTSGDLDYFNLGELTPGTTVYASARPLSASRLSLTVGLYNELNAYQPEAGEGRPFDGAVEVNLTQTGRYYLQVRDRSGRAGLFEQYLLDVVVAPTGAAVFPNLMVVGVVPPAGGGLLSGQPATISFVVKNVGQTATPDLPWQDRAVLSVNDLLGDADDLPLGVFTRTGALAPNGSYTVNATVALPDGSHGDYYLIVQTDYGNAISEFLFEGDNVTVSDTTFRVTRANYPDLRVEDLAVAGPNASDEFAISWRVANRGERATGTGFQTRVLVRNLDASLVVSDTWQTVPQALAQGASLPQAHTFAWNVPGPYQVTVIVDAQDQVYEFDSTSHASAEQNNTVHTRFDIALDLQAINLTVLPDTGLRSGDTVTIRWDDINQGAQPTRGSWHDSVQVVNTTTGETLLDTQVYYDADSSGSIGAGAWRTRQLSLRLPDGARGTGTFRVTVTCDVRNAIGEHNPSGTAESNNATGLTFASVLGLYPDLAVYAIQAPATVRAGQPVWVQRTLANRGASIALGPWQDAIQLADTADATAATELARVPFTGALAPGAQVIRSNLVVLPPSLVGQRFFRVFADIAHQLYETDDTAKNLAATASVTAWRRSPRPSEVPGGRQRWAAPTHHLRASEQLRLHTRQLQGQVRADRGRLQGQPQRVCRRVGQHRPCFPGLHARAGCRGQH